MTAGPPEPFRTTTSKSPAGSRPNSLATSARSPWLRLDPAAPAGCSSLAVRSVPAVTVYWVRSGSQDDDDQDHHDDDGHDHGHEPLKHGGSGNFQQVDGLDLGLGRWRRRGLVWSAVIGSI